MLLGSAVIELAVVDSAAVGLEVSGSEEIGSSIILVSFDDGGFYH